MASSPSCSSALRTSTPSASPKLRLNLPRRDAPVDVVAGPLIRLLAAYDQLAALDGDGKLIDAEARDGKRNAKRAWASVLPGQQLDIVGRVAGLRCSDEPGKPTAGLGTEPNLPSRNVMRDILPSPSSASGCDMS